MSVIGQIVVESRRYSGWVDPRYPIGYWQAALSVTGDASGGILGLDLVFQGAVPPALNSQMYSVERLGMTMGRNSDETARLVAVNMAGPRNKGFEHQYSIELIAQTGNARSAIEGNQLSFLPWFLGSQRTPGVVASLSAVFVNTDTIVYTIEAEGYRWSPRSVLVDGGPQRPPTGLYRA